MEPSVDTLVRAEQARVLFRQAPAGFFVTALLGGLLIFMVSRNLGTAPAVGWYAVLVAVASLRLVLWQRFRRLEPSPAEAVRWGNRFFVVMLATSLVWGSGSVVLIDPGAVTLQLGVAATVVCLAAGVAATAVSNTKAVYLILAVGAPYTLAFAVQGKLVPELIAVLIASCSAGTALLAWNNGRRFAELVALRHEAAVQRSAAERANLAKSKFLAAASHDLRQPLHAMMMFAGALEGRLADDRDRRTLARLQDSMGAMRELFDSLLDISRLDAGVVVPKVRDFSLTPLFERLGADFSLQAAQQQLAWHCEPTAAVVRSDPALLETLLRNLVGNALRHTRHGSVRLWCEPAAEELRISVKDTGPGIASGHHAEIFREFHQLENAERDPARGLGLGLAIVDRLARLLGHRIELTSAPGEGSCFSVVLPAGASVEAHASRPAEGVQPADELEGMSVVVIDDDAAARDGLRALLERWGCAVSLASSEDEAAAQLRGAPRSPELIVVDLRLHEGRSGIQAIDRLRREAGWPIPALIVTGDTAPEHLRAAHASGHALLHKPVAPARLRAFLRGVRRGAALPGTALSPSGSGGASSANGS